MPISYIYLIYCQIELTNCLGKETSPQLYDQRLLSVHALHDACENETSLSELSPTTATTTTNTTALSLSSCHISTVTAAYTFEQYTEYVQYKNSRMPNVIDSESSSTGELESLAVWYSLRYSRKGYGNIYYTTALLNILIWFVRKFWFIFHNFTALTLVPAVIQIIYINALGLVFYRNIVSIVIGNLQWLVWHMLHIT